MSINDIEQSAKNHTFLHLKWMDVLKNHNNSPDVVSFGLAAVEQKTKLEGLVQDKVCSLDTQLDREAEIVPAVTRKRTAARVGGKRTNKKLWRKDRGYIAKYISLLKEQRKTRVRLSEIAKKAEVALIDPMIFRFGDQTNKRDFLSFEGIETVEADYSEETTE